jgi:predicted aconitase with swiveling domain
VTNGSGPACEVQVLAAGSATGEALVLEESLSLWGGMDPHTGRVIDPRHPQFGAVLAGRVVLMPSGRGSSSSSSVLAESVRAGSAPRAIVLREPDAILAVGAVVAAELYRHRIPVVVAPQSLHRAIRAGDIVLVEAAGNGPARVEVVRPVRPTVSGRRAPPTASR